LILVLTLLAIAAAFIAPALSNFMRGRALDAEAGRLLSLGRAAQSRAVSEGLPILLWLDAAQGAYGTESETRAGATDPKALEFTLSDSVQMAIVGSAPAATSARHLPAIRFLPDGSIDESSPARVRLTDTTGAVLWFVQTRNRMGYEIQRSNL
jgi:Tfp pilus assembly protein FimT